MSRLTLAQLEAFYWTATLGSVDKAAGRLNLSQPSVSLRLKAMEEHIGASLFDRVGRGIRLTVSGHSLLGEVQGVLSSVEKIAGRFGAAVVRGTIRVGFAEGFAMICLSPILKAVHAQYPDLHPEVVVSTTASVEPDLHAHKLDLAFLVEPVEHDGFTLVPLGAQETAWIAASSWDLPQVVTPHDLVGLPVISNPVGSINHRQIVGWFGSAGLMPARIDVCNSVAMLAHLVATGVAIGVYPNKMAENDIRRGVVRILKTTPPIADTPIFAKFRTNEDSNNIRAFLDTARQVLSGMDYLKAVPFDGGSNRAKG
ncbi:MAG TPA: LysR family transcriptional regulator [Rhizobiaceae bacterium]